MISSSFALFLSIVVFAGIALLAYGICNVNTNVAFAGTVLLSIEAAFIIAVCLIMLHGDMQLWKTDKLNAHIAEITQTKEKIQHCYTINNNKLCGEFIYEDATHRYEFKNNTLMINLK